MKKLLAIFIGITFGTTVMASNIVTPYMLPTAKVLPKGVRNVNFKYSISTANSAFTGDGTTAGLANQMNLKIYGSDIIIGKDNNLDKAGILQKLRAIGADENTEIAQSIGQINAEVQVSVPVFAWGITKKWTTAIALPIYRYSINLDTGVKQTNKKAIKALRSQLKSNGMGKEIEELDRKLADPIRWKARDYGYKELSALENTTALGDLYLINKYQFINTPLHKFTVTGGLTLPIGKQFDPDKLVNVNFGDGQTDLIMGLNYDFELGKHITLSTGFKYTVQFADTVERRMPEQAKSLVGREKDSNISRNLGDIVDASFATNFHYKGGILALGYNYVYQERDTYTGQGFSANRYAWLANNSEQVMHTLLGQIGYETITSYKEGKFPVPLLFSLTYTNTLAGKNVVKDPLATFDISMFF